MAIRSGGLLAAVALPLALLVVLFSGSLALDHLDGQPLGRLPSGPVAVRNLVAAPFTEELCFRAGLISYLTANGTSRAKCIWLSPTLFGLAHLHHAAELVRHQNWTVKHAILACFMQFLYTSAFGWFAAFLFLRTGHLAAVVVAHAFCNFMGLPRFQDVPGHPKAALLVVLFIGGIVGFSVLLHPLTEPALYGYPPGQHYPSTP